MRLWSSGFELNTTVSSKEWGLSGSPLMSAITVRSGGFSGRISGLSSGVSKNFNILFPTSGAASNGPFFFRFYINIATLPSAANTIFRISSIVYMTLDNTGVLQLSDEDGSIGSPSPVLSTGTWYCVEVKVDRTPSAGSHIIEAKLDQVTFVANSSRNWSAGLRDLFLGGNVQTEAQTQGEWFFDDVGINDAVGSYQNSWIGPGKIIHLRVNAAGDINTFATQTGGIAGSANNFSRVSEVSPDDATTFNGSNTLNEEDLFNVMDSGLSPTDRIILVSVGARFRNNVADATTAIKLELEKISSGTIIQSVAKVLNTTSFVTNSATSPRAYPITSYIDPNNDEWNFTSLANMQIGYKISAGGTNRIEVSAVWALIEYIPGENPILLTDAQQGMKRGVKIWP